MTFPLAIPPELRARLAPGTGVLLGLSGGVDSAVTLAVLRELGCDVQCVTFKNFCYDGDESAFTEQSCCSLEAIEDARRLARRWGAAHWVGDVSADFRTAVIEPFVAEYRAARTPNPCLDCNGGVRFPELVRLADRQGCAFAATGHYARVVASGDTMVLQRGVDPAKDQAYFLHRVPRDLWPRLVFPLGWWTKTRVREAARDLEIPVADKRDSQEICFVPDDDRGFLFADGEGSEPGAIVDRAGRELGRHRGLVHYTVGQRRGLGLAAEAPLYVVALDPAANRVVVGGRDDLAVTRIRADRFVAAVADLPDAMAAWKGGPVTARVRHRHTGVAVNAWGRRGDEIEVALAAEVPGVAPGQGLVLYAGDTVLGGGRIVETDGPKETE